MNVARQDDVNAAVNQVLYMPLLILLSSAVGGDIGCVPARHDIT